jgi:hypothetical protein
MTLGDAVNVRSPTTGCARYAGILDYLCKRRGTGGGHDLPFGNHYLKFPLGHRDFDPVKLPTDGARSDVTVLINFFPFGSVFSRNDGRSLGIRM